MPAYGNMDVAFPGMQYGLENDVVSRLALAPLNFGRPAFAYIGDESGVYPYFNDASKLVFSADLVASNVVTPAISGFTIAPVTFATSHLNTVNLLIASFVAAGLEAMIDTSDATNRTLIVRKKGVELPAASVVVTLGASQATVVRTAGSTQIFIGATVSTQKETAGVGYGINDAVNILEEGKVSVVPVGTAKANDVVYLDVATGRFATSGVALNALRWFTNSNSGFAVLSIDAPQSITPMALAKF